MRSRGRATTRKSSPWCSPAPVDFARRIVKEKWPLWRVRDMDEKLEAMRRNPEKFDELAASLSKRTRGLHAPAAAIEAVRWSLDVLFDDAEKRVRSAFQELRQG